MEKIEKIVQSPSFLYGSIVFLGFFDKYTYYFNFNIDITNFLTISEILFSFLPKTIFLIPILGLILFAISLFGISKENKNQKPPIKHNGLFDSFIYEFNRLELINRQEHVFLKTLNFLGLIFYFTIKLIVISLLFIYPLIIGFYYFFTEYVFTVNLLLNDWKSHLLFFPVSIAYAIFFIRKKEHSLILVFYGIIIIITSLISSYNSYKAFKILNGTHSYQISLDYKSRKITTNDSLIFIGKTEKNIFLRNLNTKSNIILKTENIENLNMRKIN